MPEIKISNVEALGLTLGQYSHITRVKASELLYIAGQLSTNREGQIVGAGDFDAQCTQVFAKIETALKSCGAGLGNVVEFTTYMVHSQDIPKFMTFRKREFPRFFPNGVYPPNTLLMIDPLVRSPFLLDAHCAAD